ncbi:carboxymuconolactone decarboxylase family protein [Devosia faecipullorum]|uniref:carboxymuconolactone decarboxylase family protein n=1 Tax=Devosia faecipullorum TaxID=2755039 RepID=UPI00187B8F71|nr:carboxymuconolactone decarboxylase family protein [Devosia faecipullorum]MBE7734104.1 carboxymuconolactone decarboxylase family protein [Devosia faecipullorum]
MNQDEDIKSRIERLRGYWHPFHQGLLELSPDYLDAYLAFQHAPFVSANLEAKVCEFIYIAVDGAVSHLYASGAARHIEMALAKGASKAEVLEVIQLTTLSAHMTLEAGMPALLAGMGEAGLDATVSLNSEQQARKDSFVELAGYWPEGGDAMFVYAPHFVDAYLRYAEIPYRDGPLPPKVKEFVRIAVCATPAGPQPESVRRHIGLALRHGATPAEIADVLQLSSAIAIHTCTTTVPPLMTAVSSK